jgi:hypothetical protein
MARNTNGREVSDTIGRQLELAIQQERQPRSRRQRVTHRRIPREVSRTSVVDRLRLMRELCRVVADCETMDQPHHHVMAREYLGELATEIERALWQVRRAAA